MHEGNTRHSREKKYKTGTLIGLKHNRTRKSYKALPPSHWNPKGRHTCSNCKMALVKLKADLGASQEPRFIDPALYCPRCEVIFPKYKRVIASYE